MIGVTDRLYELSIGSSILTRRGGTDANAPESPRKAILQDWHVGILAPFLLGIFWKMDPTKAGLENEHGFSRVQDLPKRAANTLS